MTKMLDSKMLVRAALSGLVLSPALLAQQPTPFFTPGNLVVLVEGCGVNQGTCTSIPNGTGTGSGNSSAGGYGDNQAAPVTLFQFKPTGTASASFVNSLVLPQTGSGANLPIAGEYGSSSEGGLQLSGQGQYLTLGTYGINAAIFNANPTTYGAAPSLALAQSGSLTGQSYTPVPRVVTLVDPFGNVNSSTAVFNIFNTNNPRSVYSANGTTAYLSGQGASGDATGGVFYTPLGAVNNSPTPITGLDTTSKTVSQDTRFITQYNGTLYVSVDTKGGSNNARSFIGTLGNPPATSLYDSSNGPTQLTSTNNASTPASVTSAGKIVLTASEANTINAPIIADSNAKADYGCSSNTVNFNLSPSGFFFANASTLYIADTGNGKQTSANCAYGDGGLQKWINTAPDGSGTWKLMYTMSLGLNLVANPNAVPANTSGTTGLYGLTGVVNGSTVYLYATNATIADLDPTYLYGISDNLTDTVNPATPFTLLATAPSDSNFKGVSFAPSLPAGSATITTVPAGLQVTTAGTGCAPGTYVTPVTLVWTPGSACTLTTTSPQTAGSTPYVFTQWQDGTTSTTDAVTAPTTSATYTATFSSTYQPLGSLDKAVDNTTSSSSVLVGDSLLVSGWAADPVDGSPLANVKVYVDGALFGTPTLNIARPDVATTYNNPAYANSGYQLISPTSALSLGAHAVTVIAIDAAGHSTTLGPVSFNLVATPVITVPNSSIVLGTATTILTANIAYTGTAAPTGAVTFTVNGSASGVSTTPVLCTTGPSPITCKTSYTSSALPLGANTVVATLAASTGFNAASGSGTLTVTAATDFNFTTSGTTTQTVTKGSAASFTFNLSPAFATYPGTVTFSASGLPSGATASFNPSSFTGGGAAQPIILTIQTSATAANLIPTFSGARTSLALAALCLLPFTFRRRLRSNIARNLVLLLFLGGSVVGFVGLTGCSSSSAPATTTTTTTSNPTTSTITVTATSGSIQHTTTVTLIVQ